MQLKDLTKKKEENTLKGMYNIKRMINKTIIIKKYN